MKAKKQKPVVPVVTPEHEKRCEERIDKHLKATLESMENYNRPVSSEEDRPDPLSIEEWRTYKVLLSWGGPADWFELHWDVQGRCWLHGAYVFQDWGDSARRFVTYEQTEALAEYYGIYPE
jgi:hypothetical protein